MFDELCDLSSYQTVMTGTGVSKAHAMFFLHFTLKLPDSGT